MNSIHTIRLGQFWDTRLKSLVKDRDKPEPLWASELLESIGWLIEGVFCGFFDPTDADVLWITLHDFVAECSDSLSNLADNQAESIRRLLKSSRPFKTVLQMPNGRQKDFELPIFAQALLLADRFSKDDLARIATAQYWKAAGVYRGHEAHAEPVAPADIHAALTGDTNDRQSGAAAIAGQLRLMEHMNASQEFFAHAKSRAKEFRADFDSYCQRIGGLNAWRVPLIEAGARISFEKLAVHTKIVLRNELKEQQWDVEWESFEVGFDAHVRDLLDTWEIHHMAAHLQHP